MDNYEDIQRAAAMLRGNFGEAPACALVLGSGLGGFAEELSRPVTLPYGEIPGFPASTAPGHAGRCVAGFVDGVKVLAMQGRFHCYEGGDASRIAFPVRVLRAYGIQALLVTNAAGGVNTDFKPGDFMLIKDHINLSGRNPLVGPNDERIGPRFPDMSKAYDPQLRQLARETADALGISLREGVYAWFLGPAYETPAEIRMARVLGADAVGMSTVPEVIAAVHCGLRVLGISCITNMAAGILDQPITSDEVLEISARRQPDFSALMRAIIARIAAGEGE
jgi:purine-nucleoside phosphorylase